MKKLLSAERFDTVRRWIYRNARPLDLARFRFHFEGGSANEALYALAAYQNPDGGFAHGLEADCLSPVSSPMQTWCATHILKELGVLVPDGRMIPAMLNYLASGQDYANGRFAAVVPANNEHPHAPWWSYVENEPPVWEYNPTASLAGFLLCFAQPGSDARSIGERSAKLLFSQYMEQPLMESMHDCACLIELYNYCRLAGCVAIDTAALMEKLHRQVSHCITKDTSAWVGGYVCRPSFFIRSNDSVFYPAHAELAEYEADFIIDSLSGGLWDVTWDWGGAYPDAWPVARNWWRADSAINNLL